MIDLRDSLLEAHQPGFSYRMDSGLLDYPIDVVDGPLKRHVSAGTEWVLYEAVEHGSWEWGPVRPQRSGARTTCLIQRVYRVYLEGKAVWLYFREETCDTYQAVFKEPMTVLWAKPDEFIKMVHENT